VLKAIFNHAKRVLYLGANTDPQVFQLLLHCPCGVLLAFFSKELLRQSMRLQQTAELQKNGRGRRRLKVQVTADEGAKNLIVIQRTFCATIQKPKHCA
jgi:hypothetical protein